MTVNIENTDGDISPVREAFRIAQTHKRMLSDQTALLG